MGEDRLTNRRSINEVEALRDVFYSFFEMKEPTAGDNENDKVLISMQSAEFDFNPFFKIESEEDGGMDFDRQMNSSQVYAYATNLTGMFDHLNVLNDRRERDVEFSQEYNASKSFEGSRRSFALDIISEKDGDETGGFIQRKNSEDVDDDFIITDDFDKKIP